MKKKIFSVLAVLILCVHGSYAQSWDAPVLEASEIYNGSVYYVQNTGHNMSISAGGNWGTQAVLRTTGMPATLRIDNATGLCVLEFSSGNTLFRDEPNIDTALYGRYYLLMHLPQIWKMEQAGY